MRESSLEKKLRLCQKGDPAAFAWLLEEYGSRLYGYFFRSTGSRHSSDDLLQELFVRLFEKMGEYRHEGRFEHWLFRIAANLVRDRFRREKRNATEFSFYEKAEDDTNLADAIPAKESGVESRLEHLEQMDQLQRALQELPELDRELILARHYGGLSFNELADQFGMPVGTALSKVHRALKVLKRILTENERET
jgi:RNA polymerase sigma-70 factor (ECF subfamily)